MNRRKKEENVDTSTEASVNIDNENAKKRKKKKRVEILDSSFDNDDNDIPKQRINNKMKYRKKLYKQ